MTKEEYIQNPPHCQRCGVLIQWEKTKKGKRKYCGNSCSALSTNDERFTPEIRKRIKLIVIKKHEKYKIKSNTFSLVLS